jgi:hypothetical protein
MSAISRVSLYGQIQKVLDQDDGTIMVHGIASTEQVDSTGEIVLADAMRAALPNYMIFPALREMHGLSAAGTTIEAQVDDEGITRIVAHVVDEGAIKKVKSKTYRGFSIGGKVTKRNPDDRKIIEGISLSEISLVDRPANPGSVLEMWKADGLEDDESGDIDIPDPNAAEEITKRDFDTKQRKKDAKNGTAMKDGSFPVADKEDLENAIRLAGKAKNPAAARAHIKRRAAALGLESMIPDTWKDGAKKAAATENQPMAATQAAESEALEKTVEPTPITPNKLVDVLNDAQASMDTAMNTPVAGTHVDVTLPGGSTATEVEVPNPEEAGQATPVTLGATPVPAVEHVAPAAATPGKDTRTNKDAADGSEPITEEVVEDPIVAARTAADNAMKAATAVLQRLSKQANDGVSPVLAPGLQLRKGMSATSSLGYLLSELGYALANSKYEEDREGDDSQVPAKLHSALQALAAAYKAMSDEELQELLDAADKTMAGQIALAAAGGDISKAFEGVIDADALAKLAGGADASPLAKAETRISALEGERDDLLKTLGGMTETMTELAAKVEAIENAPMPPKTLAKAADPAIVPVSKEQDVGGEPRADETAKAAIAPTDEDVRKALDNMSEEERAMTIMKASLSPINARFLTR